ncbi:response regulator transcription factor [Saccharopolyspora sp. NPDC002686]|uniref:helix-turn-helix transcriptional regulator n=1 Tax=Saccharopolyspora sp. NPDC002686 TaxID=3154541 RepID=UPI0033289342
MNGLTQMLMGRVEIFVAKGEPAEEVDVVVFAADRVTTEVMAAIRRVASRSTAPVVLVTSELDRAHLLGSVECRVVAVLHRRTATEERLVKAIGLAAKGGGVLPPELLGDLLRQVQSLQEEVLAPHGLNAAGLTRREIDVVRLLADGLGTGAIGTRLCYSERTVKNIIHAMTSRLKLRNRSQLVAYGLRAGVI